MANMKEQLEDQTKALAERYGKGKHATQSLWFLDQFAALNTELKKPEADLGLIASMLASDRTGARSSRRVDGGPSPH
jgi:hypothetical protein